MQVAPYLVVEGTVIGDRLVDIPARDPEPYRTAAGEEKMTRRREASNYREVGVNCPAVLNGEVDPSVQAVLTVRWPERVPVPQVGEVVRWAVEAAQVKAYIRGGFREWIVYHYRGEVPAREAVEARRPQLAATGS